jgi:hypothetical protein
MANLRLMIPLKVFLVPRKWKGLFYSPQQFACRFDSLNKILIYSLEQFKFDVMYPNCNFFSSYKLSLKLKLFSKASLKLELCTAK